MFSEFFSFKKYVVISVKAQTNVTCEKELFSLIYLMFTLRPCLHGLWDPGLVG